MPAVTKALVLVLAFVVAIGAAQSGARADFAVESPIPWPDSYGVGRPMVITGFWGTSADHLFAYAPSGHLWQWDGQQWALVPFRFGQISAMWGAPNDVWVASFLVAESRIEVFGNDGTIGTQPNGWSVNVRIAHFDGRGWTNVEETTCLNRPSDDCLAKLKHSPPAGSGPGRPLDRTALDRLLATRKPKGPDLPAKLRAGYELPGGEIWASSEDPRALLRIRDGRWTIQANATYAMVRGLAVTGRGQAWAVAIDRQPNWSPRPPELPADDRPAILRRDAQGWRRVLSPGQRVADVWASGPDDVWIAGAGGQVRRFRDGAWQITSVGVPALLETIWGTGSDDVWVHGGANLLFHWNGRGWSKVPIAIDPTHGGVGLRFWGARSDDVWAVGLAHVFHWGGRRWSAAPSPVSTSNPPVRPSARDRKILGWSGRLDAISGTGPSDVWVVGQALGPSGRIESMVLRWNGATWTRATLPVLEGTLTSLWARTPDDVWAAGTGGLVLRFDGKQWTRLQTPTKADLVTVAGAGEQVWFGGMGGALLRWDPPQRR